VEAQTIIDLTSREKVIGIGETGLDYYREHSRELQMKNFAEHIEAAQETGIPLIVHSRSADEDTVATLQKHMEKKPFTGLIHCFTGTRILAEGALALGFYISFSGVLTFKNSSELRDIAKDIPLEKLLVETDAPYLAPVPHRGKPNEPAFVAHTNRVLAEIKGISEAECARATTENFFHLFAKARRPGEMAA